MEIIEDVIRIVQLTCALLIWKKEIEVIFILIPKPPS